MKKITVVIHNGDGTLDGPAAITAIANVGLPGPPGPKGDQGDRGPGVFSNIAHLTASVSPPDFPEVNDLWIDLTQ